MRHFFKILAALALCGVLNTPALARLFTDLTPGTGHSFPGFYGVELEAEYIGGNYYVVIDCKIQELDGETGNATLIFTSATPEPCDGESMGRSGNRFLFTMERNQIWSSDGTPAGTVQLPIAAGGMPSTIFWWPWPRWPGWFLVAVDQGNVGADAVWLTDGTVANTRLLQTTGTGASVGFLADGRAGLFGSGVWSVVSPTANAIAVATNTFTNGNAGYSSGYGRNAHESRGRIFFSAVTPAAGNEPWSTDLTLAGTAMIVDQTPGPAGSSIGDITAPYDDQRVYFVVSDQLWRSTLGSGTSTKLNTVGTTVESPLTPIGDGVIIVTMTLDVGAQIWKLRDAPVADFAPATGGPGQRAEGPVSWLARWPDRTLFGTNSTATPFAAYEVEPAAAPLDVAFTGLGGRVGSDEAPSFRGDVLFLGSLFGDSQSWRRNATSPEYIRTDGQNLGTPNTNYAPRGGPLQLYVRATNATGREPNVVDLVPHGIPMCNLPGAKLADASSVTDVISVPGLSVIPSYRVLDARVHVKMQHSYVGDLTISLEHVPTARSVVLMQRPAAAGGSCASDDLDVVFDDAAATPAGACATGDTAQAFPRMQSLMPREPLSELIGGVYQGEWRITVADGAGGDIGGLAEWCLELSVGALPITMFRDGFE